MKGRNAERRNNQKLSKHKGDGGQKQTRRQREKENERLRDFCNERLVFSVFVLGF
jgi:hypothetical protein